jgi:predicted nucleotidyltransferase component of viral defense system
MQKITDDCDRISGIIFGKKKKKSKITDDKILQVNEFIIPFWGANHTKRQLPVSQDNWPSIQLDFSWNEEIATPIEYRAIYHQYDEMFLTNKIPAYSLKEILIEKIRSFEQRKWNSARDYYDVWYLMQHVEINDWDNIRTLLIEKCKIKNVTVNPNIFNDNNRKNLLKKSWENSIKMQLSVCPDFETVWFYLRDNLFQKLNFI